MCAAVGRGTTARLLKIVHAVCAGRVTTTTKCGGTAAGDAGTDVRSEFSGKVANPLSHAVIMCSYHMLYGDLA